MDSLILEKLNAGLLYLYGANSKDEFCIHLEAFLTELFRNVQLSILFPAGKEDTFFLEYSSGVDFPGFEKPSITSPALAQLFAAGKNMDYPDAPSLTLEVCGASLPVRAVKVIASGGMGLALLAFHVPLVPQEEEGLIGLEDYIFDHVYAALGKVTTRDALEDRLEKSDAQLHVLSGIGDLLGQLNLESLLSHLIAVYIRTTDAQVGSVVLEGSLGADVEWGLPRSCLEKIGERGQPTVVSRVLATGQPIFIRGYSQDSKYEPAGDFNIESFLCVPLVSKERVLGVVSLVNVDLAREGAISESEMASITTLASLASTAIENAVLHRDMIEKERIKANLDIARTIQRGMYPVRGLEIPGYDMAFFTRACDETGGDYFDFIPLDGDRSAFVVGDVSGHGIGAALLMASGRANVRALLSVKNDLKEVMDRMNDLLAHDMDAENFMTLFVGCLDHHDNSLTFVNAGHDEPLVYRALDRSVEQLDTTGLPAGMMQGWSYDVAATRPLEPGDVLLLTTDGVWEGKNRSDERFGKSRLKEALALHAGGSSQDLVDAILKTVEAYAQGVQHPDDFTVVAIKRTR